MFDELLQRFMHMFEVVAAEGHGSVWMVLFIGFVFGAIIQWSRVDKFEKIAGFAMLEDMTVPKMLFFAIGFASIFLYVFIEIGLAHYHVKPIMLGGLVIGAILFGVAMAIFGKCPGTGPISVAEGRIDVLVGAIGGIFGGLFFTWAYPWLKPIMGPDYGKLTLPQFFEGQEHLVVLIYGLALIAVAFVIPDIEYLDPEDHEKKAEL
ncbi:YeeE/YedE thiosulfate transporter family protein [Hydrogenimonas urashimensis]|uniref:YeeE/YedE thiosulfate transporter family protein n=1 Tax=Hydrogenimonas urashimensis TaxID=2740515 RepID=UPI0019159424|nr:YeeE/YedE thiosulfate transporter family protein [Hydrogenimonas urashimensis]